MVEVRGVERHEVATFRAAVQFGFGTDATMVTVLPTHRRRGLLTEMMGRHLAQAVERLIRDPEHRRLGASTRRHVVADCRPAAGRPR